MKILIRNSDNVVIYAEPSLTLSADGTRGDGWHSPQFTTANATLGDAQLPAGWVGAVWSYVGGVWAVADQSSYDAIAAAKLAGIRAALIEQIDTDTDAIYRAVQGDRAMEYVRAESEAAAFKLAGYTGTVPPTVASWASAKVWTARQATDDILATAAAWRSAQGAIRTARLGCKEIARTASDFTAVKAQWAAFLVTIRTALGVA